MRNTRDTKLLFELSETGRRAHRLPHCDVPERDRFELAFNAPTIKEFVVRDRQNRVDELLENALDTGFLAGVPLRQWYPLLGDCFLVAVTEKRAKSEIDPLATSIA